MAIANIKRVDGNLVLPLSEQMVQELAVGEGSPVEIAITSGKVSLSTNERRIPKYNLAEVLAEHAQLPKEMHEYREWVDAPPVGRELI